MLQTAISRAYIFSDADLKQKADALMVIIKRDKAKFATRNIRKDILANFQQMIDVFADASTDEELLGLCKKATEEKDGAANILRRLLRSICNMAELAFEGKGHFHSFGFEGISEMNDKDLCVQAKQVIQLGRRFMDDLKPQGLLDSHLEALASFEAALDAKVDAYNKAVEHRDIETQAFIVKGNALYFEMMRLASVGKSLFEEEDEARYNDYIIIGGSSNAEDTKDGTVVVATATDNT
jgi:hypothetical protein